MMIIYQARCLTSGKIYVGQTKTSLEERRCRHEYNAFSKNMQTYFYRALRKYGKDDFEWSIIYEASELEDLDVLEIQFIESLNTLVPNGYNLTKGGDGGDTFSRLSSEEQDQKRRKMSLASTGRRAITTLGRQRLRENMLKNNPMKREEVRRKVSEHHADVSGENNPMYGKTHTDEVKKKLSILATGRVPSDDVRALWSRQRSGAGNPKAHPIRCVETGEVFSHIKEALSRYGQISISRAIREKKTAGGYHWERITKEEYESIL